VPQFFVFPLILVATLTVIYLGLRWLSGSTPSDARQLLMDLRLSGPHSRWQVAQQLADGLQRGRLTLDSVPPAELAAVYEGLVPASLAGFDQGARQDAIRTQQFLLNTLAFKGDPALTHYATEALASEESEVRMAGLYALLRMEDPAAVPALTDHLGSGIHEERLLALGGLARLGTPEALDAISGLVGGADTLDHRNAVLALADNRDARAMPWLVDMLDRSSYDTDPALDHPDYAQSDEATRVAARTNAVDHFLENAARAAGKLGDPTLVPPLERLKQADPSVKVQSAALNALHSMTAVPETN
jgi:HEAT repeat protein